MKTKPFLSRRGFLKISSLATGGMLLERAGFGPAMAAGTDPKFLLLVYFSGGWDQLLAFDPRDNTLPQYNFSNGGMTPPSTGIQPAYQAIADSDANVQSVLNATAGKGVQTSGALTFGPAVPQSLISHASDFCIVRGMLMDTLTHDVGRRYLLTGKFPRGLQASGSSLNTVVAGQTQSTLDLPNLAIDVESYNEGYPSFASPTNVGNQSDLVNVLSSQTPLLTAGTDGALHTWEGADDSCTAHGYDVGGLVASFKASREQARTMTNSAGAANFKWNFGTPTGPIAELIPRLGITSYNDFNGVRGNAAMAAIALTQGVSQAVAVTLGSDLDDHFDEPGSQSVKLRTGFEALGGLIQYLKDKQVPGLTKSFWQCTTMMVFSEFSRTPMVNARDGRDHHLTGSCLLAGPGIKGNTVFGASSEVGMQIQKFNASSGLVDANGLPIRPPDVHRTLLTSMGLSWSHLSNQSPNELTSILK